MVALPKGYFQPPETFRSFGGLQDQPGVELTYFTSGGSGDAAGNMATIPHPLSPGNSFDLKWDAWKRLVEVKNTGGSLVATYRYDGNHRRVTNVSGGATRHYYDFDQWQVLEERIGSDTDTDRRFVWGVRGPDHLVLRDRDAGSSTERLYALNDSMSLTSVCNTSGTVRERYGYDGFGRPRYMTSVFGIRSGSSYDWETLFHSYRYDTETGLYQVRYRYLHSELGRWLSRDPIEEEGGVNLYRCAGNDPVNQLDYLGLSPPKSSSSGSLDLGCKGRIWDLIDGIEDACNKINACEDCSYGRGRFKRDGKLPGRTLDETKRLFENPRNLPIACQDSGDKSCESNSNMCAYFQPKVPGGNIVVCDNASSISGCLSSSLGCVIAHKIYHFAAHNAVDSSDLRHPDDANRFEKCIDCPGAAPHLPVK